MPTGSSTSAAPAAVHVDGWGWRYAGRSGWAARGVDLRIQPGERVLLLGASGAGKSTLLAGLAGVLGGDDDGEVEGTLTVAGRPPAESRGTAGLLLQDPDAQVILARVGDDVAFGCENLGVPRDELWSRVRAALGAVGLDVPLDRATAQLSGGQKQRLALAGLLAMRPGVLLLDEPTANLDPDGVLEVRDAVRAALDATGATLVVVEHRVAVWRDLVTRVVVLGADGGILADGEPDAVLADRAGELARAGVWLPGAPLPDAPLVSEGAALLTTRSLVFGRGAAVTRRRRRGRPVVGEPVGHPVDLEVREGSALALTGRNGAGKSTLALTLGGLLPPLGGMLVAEPPLAGAASPDPAGWRSRELLTRIGSVFQNPEHQFIASTVREELAAGPRALRLAETEVAERVDGLLERLALTGVADANPFTLSGGQKRRLSVGTALATRPRLLVLDEPTFGQDARTWDELVRMIAGLRHEGHAVIAATHDAEFVQAVGAARLRLDAAEVVA
ncbi:ABC transporter ATP-binding protein [Leifsonia sp. fls2-241-R2A-40a]|uniref:ABC transporter ATP-binding protein n=1 Tax=Leifsonia sp. fls2-241-R2A-40a TaxID=3040290 RepID=UPI002551760C|nr:ABC transporter ATP-binding protein [Leifsonia sp. fls2-241-R2A-40a]